VRRPELGTEQLRRAIGHDLRADGQPVSVVDLKAGDKVLCRTDQAGRHFGMRITEEISE